MNLELEIKRLERSIAEAQNCLNRLKEFKEFEDKKKEADLPKEGDEYWYVAGNGRALPMLWCDDSDDERCLSLGNCFRTKEEAEKELEARKVIAELRQCKGARKFVSGKYNFSVSVRLNNMAVAVEYWEQAAGGFGQAYFETREQAEAAIQTVGVERILAAAKWLAMGES